MENVIFHVEDVEERIPEHFSRKAKALGRRDKFIEFYFSISFELNGKTNLW